MNATRILILACLIAALGALAYMYMNMNRQLETITYNQTRTGLSGNNQPSTNPAEPSLVPQAFTQEQPSTVVVENPVTSSELARLAAENEKMKLDYERLLKNQNAAQEEQELLKRSQASDNDPKLELLNQITEAQLVGRVVESYPQDNVVMFNLLGDAVLQPQQELAIRRKNGVLAIIVVEYEDSNQKKLYSAHVKRNSLYDASKKTTVDIGDEVIVVPAALRMESISLPPVPHNQNNDQPRPTPLDLEKLPTAPVLAPGVPGSPVPHVAPWEDA